MSAVRVILIAAKQLAFAKTRLASALPSSAERASLAAAMFHDVLSAALSARAADRAGGYGGSGGPGPDRGGFRRVLAALKGKVLDSGLSVPQR